MRLRRSVRQIAAGTSIPQLPRLSDRNRTSMTERTQLMNAETATPLETSLVTHVQ